MTETTRSANGKTKGNRRLTKTLIATVLILVVAGYSGSLNAALHPYLEAAFNTIIVLLLVFVVYNVIVLVFEVRKFSNFSVGGLLAILVTSFLFHWIVMIFIDGAAGSNLYDSESETFLANSVLYSTNQLLNGLAFDFLEGLRIDLAYLLNNLFDMETSIPEPAPNSSLAIFDAFYRSAVTGITIVYLGNLIRQMRGRN